MFQYGYTNFQKKGYRFASENEFFHASLKNRNAKLAQLVNHVDTKHTAYLEAEPRPIWEFLRIWIPIRKISGIISSGRDAFWSAMPGMRRDMCRMLPKKMMKHSSESRFYSCCGYLSGRDRNLCSCQARIVTGISRM